MSSESFADDIAQVEPRQEVVLSGYPSEDESEWHVNKAVQIGGGPGGATRAIVLQELGGGEHWVSAVLVQDDGGWSVDKLVRFEGEPPAGMSGEEHGDDIDPSPITVVDIRDS